MLKEASSKRALRPGLEPGREIVIIPGLMFILNIMNLLKCPEVTVSDGGLLEGVIISKASETDRTAWK